MILADILLPILFMKRIQIWVAEMKGVKWIQIRNTAKNLHIQVILKRLKDLSKEINTSDTTITEGSNESMEEKSGIEEPVEVSISIITILLTNAFQIFNRF